MVRTGWSMLKPAGTPGPMQIHPVRPQDMEALEELLREEPNRHPLVICGWLREAFDCDGKQDYPFENGIKSLSYFVKRRREREFSNDPFEHRDLSFKRWNDLTDEEVEQCRRNQFIVMPYDCPQEVEVCKVVRELECGAVVDTQGVPFADVFGERAFLKRQAWQ